MFTRWGVLVLLVVLAGAFGLFDSAAATAADTTATTLTSTQEALAQRVEGELIAPCCWVQPVAVHDSQAARDIKREVRELVAQGKTEQQILDTYLDRYGEKILAAPPARGFNLLAYLVPFVVAAMAGVAIAMLVVRWRRPDGAASLADAEPAAAPTAGSKELRDRLESELSDFDD